MTWTYAAADIASSRKDEVRFLVGDTDTLDPMVQDEEIDLVLTHFPPRTGKPAWLAAAHTCDAIAGRFGRQAQRAAGPLSISAQQRYEHYVQLAASLRQMYSTNGQTSVGGFAGIPPGVPILGGGGRTYLGGSSYNDQGRG